MKDCVEDFLSTIEEQEIVAAINLAEKNTSGEIRIHIEHTSKGNVDKRALEVFSILKMNNTKQSNAVLIYVAVNDKKFAIYGDKGINKVVPNNFWDSIKNDIQNQFKQGDFKQGIVDGILNIGEQLKAYFPWNANDTNELTNTISKE